VRVESYQKIRFGLQAGNGGYSQLSAVPGTGRRVGLRMVEPALYPGNLKYITLLPKGLYSSWLRYLGKRASMRVLREGKEY